jgi:3,5-epimerase/4-reductase
MKLLVYGHKGWIGTQFIDLLQKERREKLNINETKNETKNENDFEYVLASARIDDSNALFPELDLVKPTHVVSFIGRTHGKIGDRDYTTIDYLEQPGKLVENVRDNLFAPLSLALACRERKIHYTYLGTGCIFNSLEADVEANKGFNEADVPNFFGSGYSVVKGFTDRLMHQLEDTVLNLRIRMPIVAKDCPRNFITKIVNYQKICSVPNSMSVLPELLPIALRMIQAGLTGTMNLTNPDVISHNEILELYKERVDPSFTWQNFSIEEQRRILACERSNNLLDTSRLEQFAPEVRPIKKAVLELFANYSSATETKPPVETTTINLPILSSFLDSPDTILFVTGGAGFIGSNFINELFKQYTKIKVINYDALYYCADEEKNIHADIRADFLGGRYTFVHGNLLSFDLIKHIFQTNKITHVLHFAAQSHVQTSFTDAIQYTKDNVLGTHHLLEAARLYCPTLIKFIHVSTDEVYGESLLTCDEQHKTEQSVLCPTNPYAATKAGAELIAQAYFHSFKMPIIITRGNNVYGPNQYPEKVIPRFIQQLQKGEKITIQGDGSCVRAFLHAYDVAEAFIKILEKGHVGEIYNIGCDEGMEYSILDVAKLLIRKIKGVTDSDSDNEYKKWITFIEDRPFNDQRYYISNNKLKQLGWDIKIKFQEGMDMLIT